MANEKPVDLDWAAARGEKWRAQLPAMEAMLASVDEPLLGALRLDAPLRIADVACGGGGTTLEIWRRAPSGSVVEGFDIAPALVEAARARVPAGERAVTFTVADVTAVAPPERPYDRLVSRFGTMFFDDPPAAFRSLARWLAPGGRFAFAVWAPPNDNPLFTVVRDVVAELVDVPPPVPNAPGPFRYGQVETLLGLLREASFTDLVVNDWRGQLPVGGGLSAADATDFALAAYGFAEPLAKADAPVRERGRRILIERFSKHVSGGVVRMGTRVHIVEGSIAGS